MALKLSTAARNARLDAIETAVGESAILKIRTGSPPDSISDPDSGDVLASLNLPANWMSAAANGSKSRSGIWQDAAADATGTAGHFRVYANDGSTPHLQGTITVSEGGGDMTLDSVSVEAGNPLTITGFVLTDGNA